MILKNEIAISRIGRFLVLVLTSISFLMFADYFFKSFFIDHYFEPSENENAFLIYLIKSSGQFSVPSVIELLKKGSLSIYPALFHQIAALVPLEPLYAGRFVSFGCTILIVTVLLFYSYLKTKDLLISICIALAALGGSPDFSYLLMSRVDSFFLSMGILSLVALSIYKDKIFKNKTFLLVTAGLFACTFAVLSKQTAIIFLPSCLLLLFYDNGRFYFKTALAFLISVLALTGAYWGLVDRDFMLRNLVGLTLFGKYVHPGMVYTHFKYYLSNYGYFIIAIGVTLLLNSIESYNSLQSTAEKSPKRSGQFKDIYRSVLKTVRQDWLDSKLLVLIIASVATWKMWGNGAAFSNNFFLINITTIWFLIDRIALIKIRLQWIPIIVIAVGACKSLLYPSQSYAINELSARLEDIHPTSAISEYVRIHPGRYLTSRTDDYVFFEKSVPALEASVFIVAIGLQSDLIAFRGIYEQINELRGTISNELKTTKINGVILGIQGNDLKHIFPEIDQHYKVAISESVKVGIYDIPMTLLVPTRNEPE